MMNIQDKSIFTTAKFVNDQTKFLLSEAISGAKKESFNTDSASVFFEDQLRYMDSVVKKVFHSNPTYMTDIPAYKIPLGKPTYSWQMTDFLGKAGEISNYTTALPLVASSGRMYTNSRLDVGVAYSLSTADIEVATAMGMNIDGSKLEACAMAIMELTNDIAYKGNLSKQVLGWLNYSDKETLVEIDRRVKTLDPVGGNVNEKKWENKSPENIVKDIYAVINAVNEKTGSRFAVNKILLPQKQYNLISQTKVLSTQTTTILQSLNDLYSNITFEPRPVLSGALQGKDTMIAYVNDSFHFRQVYSKAFEPMPTQPVHMAFVTQCTAQLYGVAMYYPESQCFMYGI
jgi:hypothetical protein